MCRVILCLLLLTLSACSGVKTDIEPYDQTFENEFNNTYTPVLNAGFKDSAWTNWNKFWFASMLGGQIADVVSTNNAVNRGCSEANPIYGSDPNIATMVIIKTVVIGGFYYLTEHYWVFESEEDQQNTRNWLYGLFAISGSGAALWNSNVDCH